MVNIHARRKPKEAPKNPEVATWPGEADSLRPDSKYPSYVRAGIQRSKRDRKFMRAILGLHCTCTIVAEQYALRTLPLYSFLPRGDLSEIGIITTLILTGLLSMTVGSTATSVIINIRPYPLSFGKELSKRM